MQSKKHKNDIFSCRKKQNYPLLMRFDNFEASRL